MRSNLSFLALLLLLFFNSISAQMNHWGSFGGGKISFQSASQPAQIQAGSIPPPVINNVAGWPSTWRGFNAAYNRNGDLLFYAISSYKVGQINTYNFGMTGIFNASGQWVADIRGSGRQIAIIAYPEKDECTQECGKFLVITHEEQSAVAENAPSASVILTEVSINPNGSVQVTPISETQLNQINYNNASKVRLNAFAVSPEMHPITNLNGSGPAFGCYLVCVNSISPSYNQWEERFFELKFEDVNGSYLVTLDLLGSTQPATPAPIQSANIGNIRFSEDGDMLICSLGNFIHCLYPISSLPSVLANQANFTQHQINLGTSRPIGVEVIQWASGRYRLYYTVDESPNCGIYEFEFDPVTLSYSPVVKIQNSNVMTDLGRDHFSRISWYRNGQMRTYTPSSVVGIASSVLNSQMPFSQSTVFPAAINFPSSSLNAFTNFHNFPYVIGGLPLISTFDTASVCCQRPAPYHWENTSKSAMGLGNNLTNQTITIEGTFTVDQNLTLMQCNIKMQEGAKIVVAPGVHLQIARTNISACKCMWDGIYVEHPTSRVTVINPSNGPFASRSIQHAINGIVVRNGAQFTLTNARLMNNFRHLQVKDFAGNYANSITGTKFGCDQAGIGRYPHEFDKTAEAILIQNVGGIDLGTNGFLYPNSIDRNEIYNAYTGIRIDRSSGHVNNFKVRDINNYGILAMNGTSSPIVKELKTSYRNDFERCMVGIGALGYSGKYNVILKANVMNTLGSAGIFVAQCNQSNLIELQLNTIDNASNNGIWMMNCPNSTVRILSNTIRNTASNYAVATGIYLVNPIMPTSSFGTIYITNNIVENPHSGIYVVNQHHPAIEFNAVSVNSHLVSQGRGTGIFAANCPNAKIGENEVTTFSGAHIAGKIGIGVDFCQASEIFGNTIRHYGDGIWIGGYSANTHWECNDIHDYWRGAVYNLAVVGPQGSQAGGQGNEWFGNAGPNYETYMYGSDGALWPFYVETNNPGSALSPINNHAVTVFIPPSTSIIGTPPSFLTQNVGQSFCLPPTLPSSNTISSHLNSLNRLPQDRRISSKIWLRKFIMESPSTFNSTELLAFVDSMDNSSGGKIALAEHEIAAGNFTQALVETQSIVPSNSTEELRKSATLAYLEFEAFGQLSLADSLWADSVAYRPSMADPNSIWTARYLKLADLSFPPFNWVEDESYVENASSKVHQEGEAPGRIVTWPNPFSDQISIQVERHGHIKLYGINGNLIAERPASTGVNELNISHLPSGVYILKYEPEGGSPHVVRLTKQ